MRAATIHLLIGILLFVVGQSARGGIHEIRVQGCNGNRCAVGYGTCFSIGNLPNGDTLFVTAGHIVHNASAVHVGVGEWIPARVLEVRYSDSIDLALVSARTSASEHFCVGISSPQVGQRVVISGFAARRRAVISSEIITDRWQGENIQLRHPARQGQSGGPVTRHNTHIVVGVVSGTSGGGTIGSSNLAILALIRETLGSVPDCGRRSPPVTQPPTADCPQCDCDLTGLQAEIESLRTQLATLQRTPGPAGPQGPKGETGATGPTGPRGERGEPGPARTVTVILQDADGNEILRADVPPENSTVKIPIRRIEK